MQISHLHEKFHHSQKHRGGQQVQLDVMSNIILYKKYYGRLVFPCNSKSVLVRPFELAIIALMNRRIFEVIFRFLAGLNRIFHFKELHAVWMLLLKDAFTNLYLENKLLLQHKEYRTALGGETHESVHLLLRNDILSCFACLSWVIKRKESQWDTSRDD